MTDDELNEIEKRANAAVSFDFHAPLLSCDHPDRGHAPACHDCERAALQEEIANRKPTFATHGRQDVHALVTEVRRLRAVLDRLPRCACAGIGEGVGVSPAVPSGHVSRDSTISAAAVCQTTAPSACRRARARWWG